MRKQLYILIIVALAVTACENIADSEPNFKKELIVRTLSPSDSLEKLRIPEIDLGRIKFGATVGKYLYFKNIADTITIKIYSLDNTNKTGLFSYEYPSGLPFEIAPGENTEKEKKIYVEFTASTFINGYYHDTLLINQDMYRVPIKAYAFY